MLDWHGVKKEEWGVHNSTCRHCERQEKSYLNYWIIFTVEEIIWSLADFVSLPTDKETVYNFNGRFIQIVKDRIAKRKSRKSL